MYGYEPYYDDGGLTAWHPYDSAPPIAQHVIPQNQAHNQLRKKVDSVASLNDIAERDMAEMQQFQHAQQRAASERPFAPYYQHQFKQPGYYNPHHDNMQYPDYPPPMTPLRQLSLNHPINHTPDAFGRHPSVYIPQHVEGGDAYYPEKRRVSFMDMHVQRAAPPPPAAVPSPPPLHPFNDTQLAARGSTNPRVLSVHSSNDTVAYPAQDPMAGAAQDQEFITISFKPQVPLVYGETVKLVLTDFEGPDTHSFAVQCKPAGAFTRASWISASKQLDMVLGADVDMDQPVTIIIPATAGIRRIPQASAEPDASSTPPVAPPGGVAVSALPQPAVVPAPAAADADEKKLRAEERRRAFLAAAPVEVATPSPPPPPALEQEFVPPSRQEDEPGEFVFDEIPELLVAAPAEAREAELSPLATAEDEGMSQAQWARMRLEQQPKQVQRSVLLDSTSVAVQSVWAKKELENRTEADAPKNFDADAVREQAQWAKEQLENRPTASARSEFDAAAVASQSKWAKDRLENRQAEEEGSKFDAGAVAEQARWARQQLDLLPQNGEEGEGEEGKAEDRRIKKQVLFNAFPDMDDIMEEGEAAAGGKA